MPGAPVFGALPTTVAGHRQLGMVYGMVQGQSAMLSFNDIYWIIAVGILPLIPLFIFLPSSRRAASAPAH